MPQLSQTARKTLRAAGGVALSIALYGGLAFGLGALNVPDEAIPDILRTLNIPEVWVPVIFAGGVALRNHLKHGRPQPPPPLKIED